MDAVMTKRNEIQQLVNEASVVIAHYWPMTGFVHHNPIRNLEIYPFHEAVQVAERFTGGRGYLTNHQFRQLIKSGRISLSQVDEAIRSVCKDDVIEISGRKVSQFDVLRSHLLLGITAPSDDTLEALVDGSNRLDNEVLLIAQDSSKETLPAIGECTLSNSEIRKLAEQINLEEELPDEADCIGKDMTLLTWCDKAFHKELEWLVNKELIKWCGAFLDEGHGSWAMPCRDKGFYSAWKTLASMEWSPCGIENSQEKIKALPDAAEDALLEHLDALKIPQDIRKDYLSHQLTSLCGWASFINWRQEHSEYPWQETNPVDLVQYLAVRLFYEREMVNQTCRDEASLEGNFDSIVSYAREKDKATLEDRKANHKLASAWKLATLSNALRISSKDMIAAQSSQVHRLLEWLDEFPESAHGPIWLRAYEAGYQEDLIEKLREQISSEKEQKESPRPLAQLMFCIDVRSEPFRRNLESVGNYDTIGFAGFFGIPMRCKALDQYHETDQLPAIVAPKYLVHEVARDEESLKKHKKEIGRLKTIYEMLRDMKFHVLTPFVMVESLGWLFGFQLFGRTLIPRTYRKWRKNTHKSMAPPISTEMTVDRTDDDLGLTEEEQAAQIEGALKTMGLVDNFGRLVIVAGHTSTSDNNPYEAALNCGACGGNSGKPNARLFAAMANKPSIREHLAKNGVEVPEDTHFIGAVHDTTTDAVDLFDLEDLPESHKGDVEQLKKDLKEAKAKTNYERCTKLPGIAENPSAETVAKEIGRRAGDWSETRPEWGLAGNAAFIIGGRTMTKELNLEGRAFLNSHDYRVDDEKGSLLTGIILGPMVVGQWINAEHYFSATDTEVYGSGSKIYHNVVGRIGIMSGPQSDLRTGLAWQSMMDGEKVYHEPLRITVVIEAPRERIHNIFESDETLKQLRDHEWIHLVSIEPDSEEKIFRYQIEEGWIKA